MELYHDHFQNYKRYNIPKAQLIIADIPFNIGNYAYASNPSWYKGGDNKNGESELAGSSFFDTDKDFRVADKGIQYVCAPSAKRSEQNICCLFFHSLFFLLF